MDTKRYAVNSIISYDLLWAKLFDIMLKGGSTSLYCAILMWQHMMGFRSSTVEVLSAKAFRLLRNAEVQHVLTHLRLF